jgi:hypothetical protein
MEETKVVKLKYPVQLQVNGTAQGYTEVTLRRIKGKDLKAIPETMFDPDSKAKNPTLFLPLIASMSGLPMAVLDEMDMEDIIALIEAASPFLSRSPETGAS